MARVPVTFIVAGQRFSIRPDELSVAPRWAEAVEAAAGEGRRAWTSSAASAGSRCGSRRSTSRPKVSAYNAAVSYEIGLIAAKVDQANQPARLVRHGLTLTVVPGQAGAPARPSGGGEALILTSLASLSR